MTVREILPKLLSYGLTAGTAAVVDAGGFETLVRSGLDVALAGTVSFCVAAIVNYHLTGRFVFGRKRSLRGFALFISAALVGLAVNVGITTLGFYGLGMQPLHAKLTGIGGAFFVNFALNLHVVFRPTK